MISQLGLLLHIILIIWPSKAQEVAPAPVPAPAPAPAEAYAEADALTPAEAQAETKEKAEAEANAQCGCNVTCGRVDIPYPFGIGEGCYMDHRFSITCNSSRPFLSKINLEVQKFMLEEGSLLVNSPIVTFGTDCPNTTTTATRNKGVDLTSTIFSFSNIGNKYVATGCNDLAYITDEDDTIIGGCMSICQKNKTEHQAGCYGINCCQSQIFTSFKVFHPYLSRFDSGYDAPGCASAFVVDQDWFSGLNGTDIGSSLQKMEYVPAVLDWAKDEGMCDLQDGMNSSASSRSCGSNAYCLNLTSTSTPLCYCRPGYQGNPYLQQGCWERMDSKTGYTPQEYVCYQDSHKISRVKVIILGIVGGLIGVLLLLVGTWWSYRVVKRRKRIMLKQKFFKRNGGLLLQQQLSSGEGNVEQTKLFTSKELEKATDYYNQNRILGQGGQGTVYKGMLADGKIVAIKVPKAVDESKVDQFINEVVILSQINHRNVVKLHGCCLETEVPLLVYEYIRNGTLFQYIHDQNEEFPVTWQMHLRIATEVAGALFYLHSAGSLPIYHRDIKSANILLDDKYRAKVSDFGTSRSIAADKTHLTTLVQGTFGYLDPEYFQSSHFTEKSDVYSFGIVLVELLTGQKPISSTRSEEGRSLAAYFIVSMKENRLFDIVDARVVKEGGKEEIMAVASLAKRCLHLNGKKRPTMKEVAMELEAIKGSKQGGFNAIHQNYEEVEFELTGPWDAASTSTSTGSLANSATIS